MLLGLCFKGNAQIWPGDVNNNGVVNGVDWLYYGVAFSATGPSRSETSSIWAAHNAPEAWDQFFPQNLNLAHADCNGDGLIDPLDGVTIRLNFGQQRTTISPDTSSKGLPGLDPNLFFNNHRKDTIVTFAGQALNIPISLGDADLPLTHFYGLRFRLQGVDTFVNDQVKIEVLDNAWIGSTIQSHDLYVNDISDVDFAVTRFDQQQINGAGPILNLQIVVEENLVFNQAPSKTFQISFDSILLVDNELNIFNLAGDTLSLKVFKDSSELITSTFDQIELSESTIQIFPNPGTDRLKISGFDAEVRKIEVYDINGLSIFSTHAPISSIEYDLNSQAWPAGIYWVKILYEQGFVTKKVLVQH